MSNRSTKLAAPFFILAILVASQHAEQADVEAPTPSSRGPASIRSPKEQILKPIFTDGFLHTEKIRGPISAELQVLGPSVIGIGETFVIRGVIKSSEEVSDVLIRWNIPQGLELISGQLQDSIQQILPSETAIVELRLKKLIEANVQVHLVASSSKDQMQFSEVAQYNTTDQEKIDKDIKRLAESNAAIMNEDRVKAGKSNKVHH